MGHITRPLMKIFILYLGTTILFFGCGPGIPLIPVVPSVSYLVRDDINLSVLLSDPTISNVNSETTSTSFTLTLSRELRSSLTADEITIVKTGSANCEFHLLGDGTQYTIQLDSFTGNGTIQLSIVIGLTTYSFPSKIVTVDNLIPSQTEEITIPTSTVTSSSAQFSWSEVSDSQNIVYQFKLCSDSECNSGCGGVQETEETEITVDSLESGSTYYACLQTVDLAGNLSGFKSSGSSFSVVISDLTLTSNMVSLSSPSSGITSSDTTPIITGTGLVSASTFTVYSDSSCSTSLESGVVDQDGEITLNGMTMVSDGPIHFYGKMSIYGESSLCIDLEKHYQLDTTPPTLQSLSNLSLTSPANGVTSTDKSPIISGNGTTGDVVTLFNESSCITEMGSGVISGGSFSINVTPYGDIVDDGNKHFYTRLSDLLGNESSCLDLNLSYQLDTTPPSNPSAWSFVALTNGGTSNDTTPEVTKSGIVGENGSSIFIFDNASCATYIGSATISGGSFTVSDIGYGSNGVDDGTKNFYGLITDIAGNSSSCIDLSLSYYLETVPPNDPSGWSMSSPNMGVTSSDSTPVIEGVGLVGENGGSVYIYDSAGCSGDSVGSAVIASESFTVNNISYQSDGSDDGTLSFYGKVQDLAGNNSSCTLLNLSYKLDTTSPSSPSGWTMGSPNNGVTSNDITPQISGSGLNSEDGGTVTLYDNISCSTSIGTATISGGSFTVSNITYLNDGADDGTHSFYGKITDIGGNSSACISLSLGYRLDTTNPSAPSGWTMSSPNSGTTSNDASPQIAGAGLAGENGSAVVIYDNAICTDSVGSATISAGSFNITDISYAVDGSDDGEKTFYGKIVDIAGNNSNCVSLALSYLYDHTVPNNPSGWIMSSPSSGETSSDATPQISGSGLSSENGGTVTIYGTLACNTPLGTASISGGSFTVTDINYLSNGSEDGTKTFYGKITDAGGNESSCVDLTLTYLFDTTEPTDPSGFTMGSPNSGSTSNDSSPQISGVGLAVENGGTVDIYDNIACLSSIGTATIVGGGFTVTNITYLNNGTQDGTKTFYGKITDISGNSSSCVDLSLGYLLDTTPPSNPSSWSMSSPNSGTTSNDVTPEIGKAGLAGENGATITIYESSGCVVPIGTSTIAGGSFTVSNISYLSDGSDDGTIGFYGKIVDVAGNSSSCVNLSLGYKLDTIDPLDPVGWSFVNVVNGNTSGNFTPQISGAGLSAENKSVVNIYLTGACGTSIGTATINAGVFTVTNITFLDDGSADGVKTFYGTITDAGGNVSNCTDLSLSYELNTSIPSVSISVPTSSDYINNTNKGNFTISGECSEDGRTVTVNATGGLSATPSCTGTSWTTNLDFTAVGDGAITITADHDNASATPAPQAEVSLTKDATLPSDPLGWSLSSPNDGLTSSDYTPQISGAGLAGENGATIDIYSNVACLSSIGTAEIAGGIFTVSNITFVSDGSSDGTKTFYGKITDVAGNSSDCVDLTVSYHLDTTNPSNPSGWTMSSPNNGVTSNDVTPQISSTGLGAEDDSTVTIYDDIACSDDIGSAVIAGGDFTISNITYLNDNSDDGSKIFYGKIVDTAGNSSSCVNLSLGYKIDTVEPSDPTGWTMSSPNSGSTTSDNSPQISGSGLSSENSGSVAIYDAFPCVSSVGTGVINSGNVTVSNISYLTNGSEDGTKSFYGKIIDVGGNESNCVALSLSYLLDITDPADPSGWTMSSPDTAITSNDNTPQVSGGGLAAENGSTITIHGEGSCGGSIGSALISGGTFTVSNITYLNNGTQDGTKTFYGLITDTAGNSSNCTDLSLGYLLDSTAPSNPTGWTIASPNNGTTSNDFTPQISGTGLAVENGSSVLISNSSDCSVTVGSATIAGGIFTVSNISYANDGSVDGSKPFYGKITDAGGNSSSCVSLNLSYLLDTASPSDPSGWTMSSPNSGTTSSDYTPQISGTGLSAENGSSVSISTAVDCSSPVGSAIISGGSFTVSNITYASDGSQDGTKAFYGKITDIAGNSSSCTNLSLTYLLDTTAPSNPSAWSMSSPASGVTSNDYTPQISKSGLASENSSTVYIYDAVACSSSIGNATIAGGSFTISNIAYASNGTQDGTKVFYGKIVDVAGNSSSCVTLSLGYLLDTTAPSNPSAWSMSSPSSGSTSKDYTPQISKSGLSSENGAVAYIYDSVGCASSIGSATIAGGSFSVSNITYASNGSQDGTKTFYGKLTDAGGNSSSCVALSLGYLLDTTAPTLSITTPLSTDIIDRDNKMLITVSGSCSENGRTVTIGATGSLSATPTCSSGSYSTSLNFTSVADGTVTITSDISDVAGNSATQASVSLAKETEFSIVKLIHPRGGRTCTLFDDGSLKCWGSGAGGVLGQGNAVSRGDGANEMGSNLSTINLGANRTVKEIGVGWAFSCALLDNATVKCWGSNAYAMLGQGHTNDLGDGPDEMGNNLSAILLGTNRVALKVASAHYHSCAILDNGTVKCWGSGNAGRLGYGNTNDLGDNAGEMGNNLSTVNFGTGRVALNLSLGGYYGCALLDDATVKCWGHSFSGQLGQGHASNIGDGADEMGDNLATVNVGTNRTITKVTTGWNHACALLDNLTVKCWGYNLDGELGLGHSSNLGDAAGELGNNLSTVNLGTGRLAITLSSGEYHNCATLDNGTAKCWGNNDNGALGLGHNNRLGDNAGEMGNNLSTINFGSGKSAVMISGGYMDTCALLSDSTVKCFGDNSAGILGQGHLNDLGDGADEMGDNLSAIKLISPTRAVKAVANCNTSCALLDGGEAKCWGYNTFGNIGLGLSTNKGDSSNEMGYNLSTINLGANRFVKSITSGQYAVCAILDNSTLKCWGGYGNGALGQGQATNSLGDQSDEMGDNLSTIKLGTGRYPLQVSGGINYFCSLLDNGSIKCWGNNTGYAQLGQGNNYDLGDNAGEMGNNLSAVLLGTNRTALSVSSAGTHNCALLDDSSIKCWGSNFYGQSGIGTRNYPGDAPGEMGDNLSTVNVGSSRTAVGVYTGGGTSCALLDNSTVKCWGLNDYGQLGQGHMNDLADGANETGDNLSTINLGANKFVTDLFLGNNHVCALLTNGSVKCWGSNAYGQLGLGHTNFLGDEPNEMGTNLSTVNIGTGRTVVSLGRGGGTFSATNCVLLDDASVKCWGLGTSGQLGQGNAANKGDGVDEMGDNLSAIILW